MNTQNFLKDCAVEKQPVLLLMSKKGNIGEWRLNYNQRKIVEAPKTEEDIQSEYWECDFAPSVGGMEAQSGQAPEWSRYLKLLEYRGVSAEGIEEIKKDYDTFINSNQEAFIFHKI